MKDFHHDQRMRRFQTFRNDTLEHILAVEREKQEGENSLYRTKMDGMKNFFSGNEGKKRLGTLFGFTAATIGVAYCFRVATPLTLHWMRQKIFAPKLVSRAVRTSPWRKLLPQASHVEMIIPDTVQAKMNGIIEATRNTATRGGIFGHLMLYGSVRLSQAPQMGKLTSFVPAGNGQNLVCREACSRGRHGLSDAQWTFFRSI